MNELTQLTTALIAGVLLGSFYFVGLWWTVRSLPRARHPWFTYFGSLVARVLAVLAGFYLLLTIYGWQWLAVGMLGFVLARLLLVRLLARSTVNQAVQ